jgi:Pup amidohydrolase
MVMAESVRRLSTVPPGVNLYKNNTDGKGASYGTHENYLMRRETPFTDIVRHLVPFFVARQVMCGSGRVGIGQDSRTAGFQLSQRSDFFEVEVGLETTLKRPIINTRDEPHAVADLYRRLHVIIGDANHCDVANLLKLGTTSLVLAMVEDRALDHDLTLARPVASLHAVSHDPTLKETVELRDGERLTAVQVLWRYYEMAERYLRERYAGEPDADTAEVMHWWAVVLDKLEREPSLAAREVDWVAKQQVLEGYIQRDDMEWSDPRLRAVDIQWSDVRPEKGIFHRLRAAGRFEELVDDTAVLEAVHQPPADTRAYFRGTCLRKYPDQIAAASWDSVIFDIPGQTSLQRVPMLEPLRGTKASVGPLLDRSPDAATLLRELASASG